MKDEIYTSAHEAAVWRDMSHFGRFHCSGSDAAALLHHLTTNDIKGLKPESGCDAALITSKARVLDWLSVYRLDSGFLVLTSPNRRDLFTPHARKFILFRQEIHIEDVTATTALFGLFGPQSKEVVESLGAGDIFDLPFNAHRAFTCDGVEFRATRTTRLPGTGILIGSADAEGLRRLVLRSGQPLCDNETYNILRVEAGLPVAGLDLTEDINPWEARLDTAISLHKGCYNGQEVIARLNTYQKIKQGLMGLKLEYAVPAGERATLQVEGRNAGFVTSSVQSPRYGPIALAYVRGDYQQPSREVEVLVGDTAQTAIVADLPFSQG